MGLSAYFCIAHMHWSPSCWECEKLVSSTTSLIFLSLCNINKTDLYHLSSCYSLEYRLELLYMGLPYHMLRLSSKGVGCHVFNTQNSDIPLCPSTLWTASSLSVWIWYQSFLKPLEHKRSLYWPALKVLRPENPVNRCVMCCNSTDNLHDSITFHGVKLRWPITTAHNRHD